MAWREPNLESPIEWMETRSFIHTFALLLIVIVIIGAVVVMDVTGKFDTLSLIERVMWYLGAGSVALVIIGCVLFIVEINHSAYSVWQYWRWHEQYHWLAPKHIPLYLLESAVISNNPFVVELINGDKPLLRDEDLSALIPDSESVIAGNDRLILLFSMLLEKLSVPLDNQKSVNHIYVNTAVEVDEFTQSALKTILSTSHYAHYQQISFCCQPDYNQQIEDIKSQKGLAMVFTLLHYSTESQEENEMGSVLLLSPHYEANALGLFPAMPFSMETYEGDIDQLLRVQQHSNTSLKLLCLTERHGVEASLLHQRLGGKEVNLLSEPIHAGTLNFHEIAGEHGDLSVYLLLASLSLSQYRQDSVILFYCVNEQRYCQINIPPNQPEPIFPAGSLILGFSALLGGFLMGLVLNWYEDNVVLFVFIPVLLLLVISIGLMFMGQVWIHRRWWPVFSLRQR